MGLAHPRQEQLEGVLTPGATEGPGRRGADSPEGIALQGFPERLDPLGRGYLSERAGCQDSIDAQGRARQLPSPERRRLLHLDGLEDHVARVEDHLARSLGKTQLEHVGPLRDDDGLVGQCAGHLETDGHLELEEGSIVRHRLFLLHAEPPQVALVIPGPGADQIRVPRAGDPAIEEGIQVPPRDVLDGA